MDFFDRLAKTDTKGGIGVALGVLFMLGLIVAMLTPVPFNEAAAWVAASLIAAWLGLSTIGKGVQRATDYVYAAVKKGTVVPVTTGTTGAHAATVKPPVAAPVDQPSDAER